MTWFSVVAYNSLSLFFMRMKIKKFLKDSLLMMISNGNEIEIDSRSVNTSCDVRTFPILATSDSVFRNTLTWVSNMTQALESTD